MQARNHACDVLTALKGLFDHVVGDGRDSALATLPRFSFINDKTPPWLGETKCFRTDQTLVR
jgi:hypothetical protein